MRRPAVRPGPGFVEDKDSSEGIVRIGAAGHRPAKVVQRADLVSSHDIKATLLARNPALTVGSLSVSLAGKEGKPPG